LDTGDQHTQFILGVRTESFDFAVGWSCPCDVFFERNHLRNKKALKQIAGVIEFSNSDLFVTLSCNQLVAVDLDLSAES
jgi:hypothetical protein